MFFKLFMLIEYKETVEIKKRIDLLESGITLCTHLGKLDLLWALLKEKQNLKKGIR
jgi:hypothetical protein